MRLRFLPAVTAIGLLAACAATPTLPASPAYDTAILQATRYKAVLIAGDDSLPVFDNAVQAMAAAIPPGRLVTAVRLSAAAAAIAEPGVRSATRDHVLDAISGLKPGPGEGCLVFATSHGALYRGLFLAPSREMLDPAALDRALARGCGNAPTVVIVSACFSGSFAQAPVARVNRIILAASRSDRASFGCSAGREFTVYDDCLTHAVSSAGQWQTVHTATRQCVAAEETRGGFPPSQPQASFGNAVSSLGL